MAVDLAAPLYPAIDWDRCVIGGSHALWLFSSPVTWTPNNIDIYCSVASRRVFSRALARLVLSLGATVIRDVRPTAGERLKRTAGCHESIIAVATLSVPGVALPVRFHGVERPPTVPIPVEYSGVENPPNIWLRQHLAEILDVPACVVYSVRDDGRYVYSYPPEAHPYLILDATIPAHLTTAERAEKYTARGYVFKSHML